MQVRHISMLQYKSGIMDITKYYNLGHTFVMQMLSISIPNPMFQNAYAKSTAELYKTMFLSFYTFRDIY